MARTALPQTAINAGELSPGMAGRFDLVVYANGGLWVQNFIALVTGEARYRDGTHFVWHTRDNGVTRLIPFEYSTEQAYILAFSDQIMRVVKDGGLVTEAAQDITGITQANPAVVTYSGADNFSNGDRVVLSGIAGMTEMNNREVEVANLNAGANTFEALDVDSTAYGAYVSGGSAAVIVEVAVPWDEEEIFSVDYAQTFDTMYMVHAEYAPQKLTRSSHTAWSIAAAPLKNNPFGTTKAASQAISAVTKANPAVVTYGGSDTYANGDTIYIDGVVGMTQLNGRNFTAANVNAGSNTLELEGIDSTDYDTYTSGGTIEEFTAFSYPSVVTFFEKRLAYFASDAFPQRMWASKGAATNADYDNFDLGTGLADEAFIYNISNGKGNRIRWAVGTEEFLALGTAGGEFKADGGNEEPLSPTNISIKPTSYYGSAAVKPNLLDSHILYIQRDKVTGRTFEFDALQDGYTSVPRNLTSDHILRGTYGAESGAKEMAFQQGNPNLNWIVKNDGSVAALTFEPREQVNGWGRHYFGGAYSANARNRPEAESVAAMPRAALGDQVYFVITRTINGETVRYMEYFADQPNIPRLQEYYTGRGNKAADRAAWLQDMYEAQKRCHHLDSALIYDGTMDEALTLSLVTGAGVTVTAAGAVFASTDEGRQIHGKRGGRATITDYVSSTVVTVTVTEDFPQAEIAAGLWYLTNDTFGGLEHLEQETVYGLCDGGVVDFGTVINGQVAGTGQYGYAIIGLRYTGIIQTMDVPGQGDIGPGIGARKSVPSIALKFKDTLGTEIGTSLYNRKPIKFRDTGDLMGRPPPLYTGTRVEKVDDGWQDEKHVYIVQETPQPCTVLLVKPDITVNDT